MKKSLKYLSLVLLISFGLTNSAYAHEEGEEHEQEEHKKENFKGVFKEGTLNLISPMTFKKDSLYLNYSHNYFLNSFPRGSNPGFGLSYVPVEHLQIDTMITLRQSPVEFELGAKYQFMDELEGSPFSLAPRLAYNTRGHILGLDVSASKIFFDDILQIGLGYRVLGYLGDGKDDGITGKLVQGIGVSSILRVWKHWNLFGDAVVPFDSALLSKSGFIWSAGIKKHIPDSPHTVTLYIGNSNESSISGRTISTGNGKYPDMLKVGFNFSINIHNASKLAQRIF